MHTKLNRTRLTGTAIAAVLAMTATPVLAQDADPLAPATEETSAPVETATPVETSTTGEPAAASDPLAPDVEEAAPAAATATAGTSQRRATARNTARPAQRAPAPAAAPDVATPTAEEVAPLAATDPALIAPPIAAEPEPLPAEPAEPTLALDDGALPIAAGAGLGLLLLGGAAAGLRRRRRKQEFVREPVSEPAFARGPVHDAPVAHRPAPSPAREAAYMAAPAAGAAGLSHVEKAKRGPTPDNPFLSLKKRLKRAAFFEQRDRAVAAGKAKPVDPTAGLPDRLVKAMAPRPAPTANAGHPTIRYGGFTYQPA
jgi:hypothetical protein